MLQPLKSTYFVRQPGFKFRPASVVIFIAIACVAWGLNIIVQTTFPSQNLVPYFARILTTLIIGLILIYVSFRLLRQNNLPKEALGLPFSKRIIPDLICGAIIGSIAIAIIGGVLYLFIPYHFVTGTLSGMEVWKGSISYLFGNMIEELMFRGFLFIIICQLAGWRLSVLIMAIPFGLFHLPGVSSTTIAWKIFSTTALYSFVFSLSYVLFRSLWVAMSVHAVSNLLLHAITGLDGGNNAMLAPLFERSSPSINEMNIPVFIISCILISGSLLLLIIGLDKKYQAMRMISN